MGELLDGFLPGSGELHAGYYRVVDELVQKDRVFRAREAGEEGEIGVVARVAEEGALHRGCWWGSRFCLEGVVVRLQ